MRGPPPLPYLSAAHLVGLAARREGAANRKPGAPPTASPAAPTRAGGPLTFADATKQRQELAASWKWSSEEELRLRRKLNDALVAIDRLESLPGDIESIAKDIESELKGTFFEHESWAAMERKLDELRKNAQEMVARDLPGLQSQFGDAWSEHYTADSDLKQREAGYLQAIDKEIALLGSSGKSGPDQQAERTKLEAEKSVVLEEQKSRAHFLDLLQKAMQR